jgi:hypothetical protein
MRSSCCCSFITDFGYDAFNRLKAVTRATPVLVCEPYGTCRTQQDNNEVTFNPGLCQ